MKTKDKIILAAIQLYNEQGIQGVTSRQIATEIGISHGNLDYHFKNKEELIFAIYEQMRLEMTESYSATEENSSSLSNFYKLLVQIENFQYKYRFFNLDVLEISRAYPKITKLLKATLELRKKQMSGFYTAFVEDGYFIERPPAVYERLMHTIRIIVTFWLAQQEVLTNYNLNTKGEMVQHISELIRPYLTQKGVDELKYLI
ncbi:TetR/AcrR family transcriptional regulator [Portibacter lacus]|uniref:TetR family transcriptional regulator n=1 Tax=Portibacter lacus TaxID=1099794 RepID=A0AA37SLL3_9BACT|nr:TetR/AcrR family transcriptional regulator [Portibacter lacus]GLR16516.1 TetR family transcriptional regulator [Portibacter lacus]